MLPQANRAFIGLNTRFEHAPCNSCNVNTSYAVTDSKGHFASGRVESDIFLEKSGSPSHFFPKRSKTYHAAAGETSFHLFKHPV